MTEGRIERLPVGEAKRVAAEAGVPEGMADLSIFQVVLKQPGLARRFNSLLQQLLFDADLDGRLRELVIMRIGWVTGSVYEWAQHWRVGPLLGAPEEDLLAVRDWESHAGFGVAERAVLAATDEVLADGAISADTWDRCVTALGLDDPDRRDRVMLDLVFSIGAWHLVSQVARSLEVPLEDDVEPWPPDGVGPT